MERMPVSSCERAFEWSSDSFVSTVLLLISAAVTGKIDVREAVA